MLARMGLTPRTLKEQVTSDAALRWTLSRIPQLAFVPVAAVGFALFWIPREITAAVAEKLARPEGEDTVPTYRVLAGFLFFSIWFVLLAIVSSFFAGVWGGVVVLLALPFVALAALAVGESRRLTWDAVRRFFVLRLQRERVAELRERQRALAGQLRELFEGANQRNERPSSPGGTGCPMAVSALGITSTVRRGFPGAGRLSSSGTCMCSRCSAPCDDTCGMGSHLAR